MAYETQIWPVIRAKWDGGPRTVPIDLVVIHTMEYTEGPQGAEIIGRDFATRPSDNKASSTIGVDSDSIVQYVPDSRIAYAAPGANHNGIQIEIAGYSSQTHEQWLDTKSVCTLALAADAAAQYAHKYNVPVVHLTNAELRAGNRGFVGHNQVSEVFKKSTHTDPGPNFPWEFFMGLVRVFYVERA